MGGKLFEHAGGGGKETDSKRAEDPERESIVDETKKEK